MIPNQVYAGVFHRIIARIVDNIITEVACFIMAILAAAFVGIGVALISGGGGQALGMAFVAGVIAWILSSLILPLAYHTHFVKKTGQTFGKKAMEIRIVNKEGKPISYSTAFIRALANGIMCIFPISLAHIIMIHLNPEKRGLHDVIAGTFVVKEAKNA